jgi:hypothetical protein
MNVSTATGSNTKYGAGRMPRRHVASTGSAEIASDRTSKAETEEAADEERAVRDFRLSDEAEE